jgi:hypothetical protein
VRANRSDAALSQPGAGSRHVLGRDFATCSADPLRSFPRMERQLKNEEGALQARLEPLYREPPGGGLLLRGGELGIEHQHAGCIAGHRIVQIFDEGIGTHVGRPPELYAHLQCDGLFHQATEQFVCRRLEAILSQVVDLLDSEELADRGYQFLLQDGA